MDELKKTTLIENMRRYGGNFVSRLSDAMAAADPVNFERICNAFPDIIEKYARQFHGGDERIMSNQWIEYWSNPGNQNGYQWNMIGYGHIPDFIDENDERVIQIMQKSAGCVGLAEPKTNPSIK